MHSTVLRAEASNRFETSERTPMGTVPLSVIWAGGRGQGGELNACKEKVKVVTPSIWRSPKPTVAAPKIKPPASPRSWRTVCGLKCKNVTQDKVRGKGGGRRWGVSLSFTFAQGVHLVSRERAYSTVTEVQREQVLKAKDKNSDQKYFLQPMVVKPRASVAPEARPQVKFYQQKITRQLPVDFELGEVWSRLYSFGRSSLCYLAPIQIQQRYAIFICS